MTLDRDDNIKVIEKTPLVSIDLVIRNERQQVLLGYRTNRPAQHYWFVPGGRIRKNERLQDALKRITQVEVGILPSTGRLLGSFDHLYADNYYEIEGLTTHYVVLAYEFTMNSDVPLKKDDQHTELQWWDIDTLLESNTVHDNTKLYFRDVPKNGFRCACR
jgi:colanic acid biosynthesis protein WcaH